MAYSESTVGGSSGGNFRVWINSIRVKKGSAAENYEQWRAEGGIKRINSGSRVWNLNGNSTYNVQLGINGVTKSGSFSYDFSGSAGQQYAWGTSTTTEYRTSSGGGKGFTSRMDINMQNSPYLTSGWVTVGDNIDTVNRYGKVNSFSPNSGWTDETASIVTDITKYAGKATLWFRFDNISTSNSTMRKINVSDPYTWTGFQSWVQTQLVNKNSDTLSIHYGDDLDGNGSIEKWTEYTRTMSIKNDQGQANPTFADFDYLDTDAAAVAITGDDQVLIQGKSTLRATIDATDAATTNKQANRANYSFTIGGYSSSETWPASGNVVKEIGVISDVTGVQDLSVRAIDSRGNSTTVTKQVQVLPYSDPGFFVGLEVGYVNDFDRADGLDVGLANDITIGAISPLTLGGSDKNAVTPTTGLRFDMAYADNGYTGAWTNIAFTQEAGTGLVNVTKATLEAQILSKMNSIGSSLSLEDEEYNQERWYVLFELTDKYGPQYYTAVIDVGRPFFRIGADGRLYYKEIEFFETFAGRADYWIPSNLAYFGGTGPWTRNHITTSFVGFSNLDNGTGTVNDYWLASVYLPAGYFQIVIYPYFSSNAGILDLWIEDPNGNVVFQFNPIDLYNASTSIGSIATASLPVVDGQTYTIISLASSKNASSTGYRNAFVSMLVRRTGDI